jgi:hypothetical protein
MTSCSSKINSDSIVPAAIMLSRRDISPEAIMLEAKLRKQSYIFAEAMEVVAGNLARMTVVSSAKNVPD